MQLVLPLIERIAQFLSPSVRRDGSTQFDCGNSPIQIVYNTAAIAGALCIARQMGLVHSLAAESQAYAYVLTEQHPNGGFPFSTREHGIFADRRYYPRPLSMILYHLLLKAGEADTRPSLAQEPGIPTAAITTN